MPVFRLNVEQLIRAVEILGYITATWPMEPELRGFKRFLRNAYFAFTVANILMLTVPVGLFAYHSRNDVIPLIKGLSEMFTAMEGLLVIVISRIENDKLQKITEATKGFIKNAGKPERMFMQKYIDRYFVIYSVITTSYLVCASCFAFVPLYLHQDFVGDVWYPFSMTNVILKKTIYVLQVIATYHCTLALGSAIIISMCFWIPAARVETLIIELKNVTKEDQLKSCIRKYQDIIQYVEDAQNAVHLLILKTYIMIILVCVCAAFPLLYKQPLGLSMQFGTTIISALQNLFLLCWPAQDLIDIHDKLTYSFFDTDWIGKSKDMARNVQVALFRCMKPLVFQVILFPSPSFAYFAGYLKAISSYFMGLRAAIEAH